MRTSWIAVLFAALLSVPAVPAQVQSSADVQVHALAVAETPGGLQGTVAEVEATVLSPGTGRVFVDTKPLSQTDMQGSARLATRVAADTLGLQSVDYDVLIAFRSGSPVIGGPSAGAVMALGIAAAMWNVEHPDDPWTVDQGVAVTGTINPDGTIGPVGGVPPKATGAADAGLHTVLYPAGQEEASDGERLVRMTDHCVALDITCRPATSVVDLIETAADRIVERPSPPVPGTADFPQLAASVDGQTAALQASLDRLADRPAVDGAPGERIDDAVATAQQHLATAEEEAQATRHYLSATESFRGLIQARYAEALLDLHRDEPERGTVEDHIERCADAVAGLDVEDTAPDWTALHAVASAQVRVQQAHALLEQAQARLENAMRLADWEAALLDASFCVERAATVDWWAGLPELFDAGPAIDDPRATALDAMDRARDMVSYVAAVIGQGGEAAARLEQAQEHFDADQMPAAMLRAVQAEAAASVMLQTATGADVTDGLLDEATQGAARAVQHARAADREPILSVSLVELSTTESDAAALDSLWTARGMALLDASEPQTASQVSHAPSAPPVTVLLALVFAVGLVVGAGAVGAVWVAVRR